MPVILLTQQCIGNVEDCWSIFKSPDLQIRPKTKAATKTQKDRGKGIRNWELGIRNKSLVIGNLLFVI